MKIYSLRWRILIGVLAAVTLAWTVVGVMAYRQAWHETEELLDAHLAQSATLLFAFLGDEAHEIDEHLPRHRYDKKVAFQIWEGENHLLTHSAGAPEARLSNNNEGFSDEEVEGKGWRVFSTWDPEHRFLVQVADTARSRSKVSEEIAWHLSLPPLFGLPVLGLLLGALIIFAFRPLAHLADSIASQAPERLQPIALASAPREIVPILERLNLLFAQVTHAQEDERRFTADAAHELRTPLAVMQTHAEVASAAIDETTRRHALDNLLSGSRRAARLLDQLLTLARLDAQAGSNETLPEHERCDLRALAIETVAQLAPAAIKKNIDIEVEGGDEVIVKGTPMLLQVLVRNLVDNAISYTPDGGRVLIALQAQDSTACLSVSDSGPGIAEDQRDEAMARFRRLEQSSCSCEGHGLGLSIVARIAELHGATVSLKASATLGGLQAEAVFPAG